MQDTQENVNHQVNVILLKKIIELLGTKEDPLESVAIDNLDVVEASLQNNLSKQTSAIKNDISSQTKALTEALVNIKDTSEQQKEVVNNILAEIKKSLTDQFASVYIKKPIDQVEILNLEDMPTSQTITNLSELEPYFSKLAQDLQGSLKVDVGSPTVNVPAPIVNVPQTQVNVPEVDLTPILDELDRQLNKIRTNSVSRPLAVRLTDGQEWIKELQKTQQAIAAYPGALVLKSANGNIVNPATEDTLLLLSKNYAIQLDDYTTSLSTYVGFANIGSLSASAVWKIFKINETTGLVITYADGNDSFDNIWDNRSSLSYS